MVEESKIAWLKNVIDSIYAVSDKSYQRRIWIDGKGPEWGDFDETSEYILDDGRSILDNYEKFGITEHQRITLNKFWDEYRIFRDSLGIECFPERFIDSPEWTKVTVLAQEVVKAFNYTYKYPDC